MIKEIGGDGSIGYITNFPMNDGTNPKLRVVSQVYHDYDAMTIQISKVFDPNSKDFIITNDGALIPFKYVYEEIDKDDLVQYCRYMGWDNISKSYPWARSIK